MRVRTLVAALAPLLVAVPALGQKPAPNLPKPKPATGQPAPAQPAPAAATQSRMTFEVTGGVGYSIVDMKTWSGYTINNSSAMAYWGAARLIFPGSGVRFGIEGGYHYHFWYNYYPGGTSYPYQYDVSAAHVAALVRLPLGAHGTFDLGGAMHFLTPNKFGGLVALMYHIPLGQALELPIGVRADAILTTPVLIPVVLSAGLGFKL